jgi:hypothetical protein
VNQTSTKLFAVGWLIICWATCNCYPLQSLKKCERTSHCQHLSIMLGYLAAGNGFEDLKFTCAMSPWSTGDMFTAWQTDGNWMNVAKYCQQIISFIAQPFIITSRQSVILHNIIYCQRVSEHRVYNISSAWNVESVRLLWQLLTVLL